jgi:uncharacterized protein YlxP (DUF503 family)
LLIPESGSLKEKRFIIKSIKERLKNKFNISVAEVGHLDKWQKTALGIATVANEKRFIDETLSKVHRFIDNDYRIEIIDSTTEIL